MEWWRLTCCPTRLQGTKSGDSCPCGRCTWSRRDPWSLLLPWARKRSGTWCSGCCMPLRPRRRRLYRPRGSPRMRRWVWRAGRRMIERTVWYVCSDRWTGSLSIGFCTACSLSGTWAGWGGSESSPNRSGCRCPRSNCWWDRRPGS